MEKITAAIAREVGKTAGAGGSSCFPYSWLASATYYGTCAQRVSAKKPVGLSTTSVLMESLVTATAI